MIRFRSNGIKAVQDTTIEIDKDIEEASDDQCDISDRLHLFNNGSRFDIIRSPLLHEQLHRRPVAMIQTFTGDGSDGITVQFKDINMTEFAKYVHDAQKMLAARIWQKTYVLVHTPTPHVFDPGASN